MSAIAPTETHKYTDGSVTILHEIYNTAEGFSHRLRTDDTAGWTEGYNEVATIVINGLTYCGIIKDAWPSVLPSVFRVTPCEKPWTPNGV